VLITDGSVNIFKDIDEKLPELRRLSNNKIGDAEATKLAQILDTFIKYDIVSTNFKKEKYIKKYVII